MEYKSDLKVRIYTFVVSLLRYLKGVKTDTISRSMLDQLVRCSTSILANYVEGQSSVSRKELTNYISFSLKSSNETKVWLRLLADLDYIPKAVYEQLMKELTELSKMLAASIIKLRKSTYNSSRILIFEFILLNYQHESSLILAHTIRRYPRIHHGAD